jgi:hypothetical protein
VRAPARFILPMLMIVALASCDGVSSVSTEAVNYPASLKWVSALAGSGCGASECMFVVDRGSPKAPSINIFSSAATGDVAPSEVVITRRAHLNISLGIAVDDADNLYLTSGEGPPETQSLAVYAAGSTGDAKPVRVINGSNTGLSNPDAVAVDTDGTTYVANVSGGSGQGSVTAFTAGADGNVAPVRTILGAKGQNGIFYPASVALDKGSNLYVLAAAKHGEEVDVFDPTAVGYAQPLRRVVTGMSSIGIALDTAGNLYVVGADENGGQLQVRVYAPDARGDAKPIRTIGGNATRLAFPQGIAVDSDGNVYVVNEVAFDTRRGNVVVFGPGANGNVKPVQYLRGSKTGLKNASAIAIR